MKHRILLGLFAMLAAYATSTEPNKKDALPISTDYIHTSTLRAKTTLVGIGSTIGSIDGVACALFDRAIVRAFPIPLSWTFSKQLREEIITIALNVLRLPFTIDTDEKVTSVTFAQSCSWISYLLCMAYFNRNGSLYTPKNVHPLPQSKWRLTAALVRWIKKNHTVFKKCGAA